MPVRFEHDRFPLHSVPFAPTEVDDSPSFPLVEMGAHLAAELRRVGWDVPGLDVTFRTHGRGTDLVRTLSEVSGATEDGPFRLRFHLPKHGRGGPHVPTGLGDATVPPGLSVNYYSDASGPSATLYVGDDWKADGAGFIKGFHVNSKLNGEPKTYLKYTGRSGRDKLVHDGDLGREYAPEGNEPAYLPLAKVENAVLQTVLKVLARLKPMPDAPGHDDASPEGDANLVRLATVERIPVPSDMRPLYAWVESNDAYAARRAASGHVEDKSRDYTLSGTGYRLASLGCPGPVPDRARDGFSFASHDPSAKAGQVVYGVREHSLPVVIELSALNDVFVVDDSAFDRQVEAARAKALAEGIDRISDRALDEAISATARTMVPYAEYDGSYGKPTVLIGRQLHQDECRLAVGKVAVVQDGNGVRAVLTDGPTGIAFDVYDEDRAYAGSIRRAEQAAERAADATGSRLVRKRDPEPDADAPAFGRM